MSRKEKKYHFIYKTIDIRNDNFYIGMHSTDNLNDGYIGSGDRLRKLIYKHDKEIFKMEILEFYPNRKELREREKEIVNSDLLKEEKCMNLRIGGSGGFINEEHRKKFLSSGGKKVRKMMIERHFLKLKTDEKYKEFYINTLKGRQNFLNKTHSINSKKKMSMSHKGKGEGEENSQYGTRWITNGIDNKKIKKDNILPNGWRLGRT